MQTRLFNHPYEGLKVVDFTQGIAGPYCGSILAQQGASVIKVEPPGADWGRLMGRGRDGFTALSVGSNIGKRGLCLDLAKEAGREIALQLCARADIVLESFRPGVMQRLGLGYEAVQARNPEHLYVSISGFGQSGPYIDRPATDSVFQAMTGLMVMNRDDSGKPQRVKMFLADTVTAVYAAQRIGSALYARAVGRGGGHVQVSLLESCAALQTVPILDDAMFPGEPAPPVTIPSGTFATADGFINVITLRDAMFANLSRALQRPDWLSDPRYATMAARNANGPAFLAELGAELGQRSTADLLELFRANDVICGAVLDYQTFRADPHVAFVDLFAPVPVPGGGEFPVPHLPGMPSCELMPPPPMLGQHSDEILGELGLDAATIAELKAEGITVQAGET